MADKFIEVGVTALRDPATGGYLPPFPCILKRKTGQRKRNSALSATLEAFLLTR